MLNFYTFSKRYFFPLWYWYAAGSVFLALTAYITIRIPYLAGKITDAFAHDAPADLEKLAYAIIGLGFGQLICRTLSRLLIFWPGREIEAKSKVDLFAHTASLPQHFLDRFGVGDLISRLSNDLGQLRVFFAFGVLMIINLVMLISFTLNQMWSKSPLLTLFSLSPLFLMILITRKVMPKLQKFNLMNAEDLSFLSNQVTEAFVNIHVVKANAAEQAFSKKIDEKIQKVYDSNIKGILTRTVLFPLISSLAGIAQIVVIVLGGNKVIAGELSVGDILAFNVYLGVLAFPLTSLGIIISIYQRGKTSLQRLNEIDSFLKETAHSPPYQGIASDGHNENIVLAIKDLSFGYQSDSDKKNLGSGEGSRELALQNFNLNVKKSEKIGIFGPVGSGKSTLFNLLTRIYDPKPGQIFLGHDDILNQNPDQVRQEIGYALQSPHLFSETIENNLRFGLNKEITEEELIDACKKACIYKDILLFQDGFQTQVGERGVRLSGGQKHRLALARLFLRISDIWVLDDILSAVDASTEERMLDHIFDEKRTIIIASHRPGPLRRCHRVLLLKQGQLVDEGTYHDLILRHTELQTKGESHA